MFSKHYLLVHRGLITCKFSNLFNVKLDLDVGEAQPAEESELNVRMHQNIKIEPFHRYFLRMSCEKCCPLLNTKSLAAVLLLYPRMPQAYIDTYTL